MIKIPSVELSPKVKQLISEQVISARNQGATWNQIGNQSPIPITTMKRWATSNMTISEQTQRQCHPRRAPILSAVEEVIVILQAQIRRRKGKVVDIAWTKKIIKLITNGSEPSESYITKFWSKHGWKCRRASQRSPQEMRPTLMQEIQMFRNVVESYIHQHQIPASNVYIMDETGLWNGGVSLRTYVDPSTNDNSIITTCKKERDTGVVAISATGIIFSQFIKHVPMRTKHENGQKVIVQQGISGINVELMKKFAQNFGENFGRKEKEVILMYDNLRAHLNPEVQDIFVSFKIKTFPIPPQSAKYLSVCDNSFFHSLKEGMRKEDTTTTEKKQLVFQKICSEYPPDIILNYWDHCGWKFHRN